MLARGMEVRGRRIAVIVVGGALALAALPAVLADSSPPPSVPAATSTAPDYTPSAAGEQFAAQVLASAPLPPGAQAWTAPPPAVLATPMQSIGVSGLIDIHELYLVDEPAGPALSDPLNGYVRAHVPAGSKEMGGGSMSGPSGDATGFFLSLPTSGPSQSLAMLLYATTATTGGQYVLRVDAQVVWVPDRSSSDAIPPPAGAQLTGFATLSAANPSSGPVSLQLGEADSARLAAAVNALPLAPGTFCMEDSPPLHHRLPASSLQLQPELLSVRGSLWVHGGCERRRDPSAGAQRHRLLPPPPGGWPPPRARRGHAERSSGLLIPGHRP